MSITERMSRFSKEIDLGCGNELTPELIKDRVYGSVFAFAIGDAMGATTEFMNKEQIEHKFGSLKDGYGLQDIVGGGWLRLKAGDVTDDTQMTECVMVALRDWIIRNEMSPNTFTEVKFKKMCAGNFAQWYASNPPDVGCQCSAGITAYMDGSFMRRNEDLRGNGALMRAMPCALLGRVDLNVLQGEITHNSGASERAIETYSEVIVGYILGNYKPKRNRGLKRPSGEVSATLDNALCWCDTSPSLRMAILGAVNDGGDADTIAAITGSLAGARWGYGSIPPKWLDQLDDNVKVVLKSFCDFAVSYLLRVLHIV